MNDGSYPPRLLILPGGFRLQFFYGWLLVAVAFVTMAVGVNARTAFSLLFPAILGEFGWDRGITAGAFSFGFLVSAVVTPFVGRVMDLRGPRIVVELGVLTMGAGLILASVVREPWQLYLTLGALVGGGVNCLAYTGQSIYLTNWFVRRRGLALSIAFSGVGIGSITILPWAGMVNRNSGMAFRLHLARHSAARIAGTAQPPAQAPARRYGPTPGWAGLGPSVLRSRRQHRRPRLGGG